MSVLFENATVISMQDGKYRVLENAFLGVEGKVIDYIGTVKPSKQYGMVKNMKGRILSSGLVNAHTHTGMCLLRGIGSGLPLQDWLNTVWPVEDRMTGEDFVTGMELALLEMLSTGTTSFSDSYWMPWLSYKPVGESGIKANLARVMMCPDENQDYRTFKNKFQAIELFEKYNGAYDGRMFIDWCIHGQYTITDRIAGAFIEEVSSKGGRLQAHACETKKETQQCLEKKGVSPIRWFENLGAFNLKSYIAHAVWIDESDMEILKKHDVAVVHNPSSNMKLGSGFAPVPELLHRGIRVALGTDGAASNNNLNMFEEMHLASVIHNGYNLDPTALLPEDILRMATLDGALAQGREDTGSLEVGKKADIIAVDTDRPHMVPCLNPIALLVYSAQGSDVCMTMVDGKILYENGEFLTLDKDRIIAQSRKCAERLGI